MELRQLEYFLAIVDQGGLGRAADHLYLSHPSLSNAVRSLERELKVSLFHRTGRRLVPTSAGRELVPLARRMLEGMVDIEDTMRRAQQLQGGALTVVCTPDMSSEAVASWATGFTTGHPDVRLAINEAGSHQEMMAAVSDGQAELGFAVDSTLRSDLQFVELGLQRFLLVRPPGHPASADGAPLDITRLGDLPLVCRQVPGHEENVIQRVLSANNVDARIGATVPSRSAQLTFVLRSGFQAFLPLRICLTALDAGAHVLETDPAIEARFGLVHRTGGLAPAAQRFIADVRTALNTWYTAIDHHRDAGLGLIDALTASRDAAY
ncbi:LysR family transcriptional regulator [Streptomyces sp. NPDC051684]|uniref:LysR family transcriptional regulator n=1 Tax=Streptomyces sp. NPDC051684 TaxID=3365670 RepID=UPI0037986C2C